MVAITSNSVISFIALFLGLSGSLAQASSPWQKCWGFSDVNLIVPTVGFFNQEWYDNRDWYCNSDAWTIDGLQLVLYEEECGSTDCITYATYLVGWSLNNQGNCWVTYLKISVTGFMLTCDTSTHSSN
jgi:hypothetical protein